MPNENDLYRTHLLLYREDMEKLRQIFGDNVGISKAVRTMVHTSLANIEQRAAQKAQPVQLQVSLPQDLEPEK